MLRAAVIGGYKKSGKTWMIERLVEEFKERGYRVGTIKHVPQEGFTLDRPETDTWRHAQAGAETVVSISPGEIATLEKGGGNLEEVLLSLSYLDLVLIEGFRRSENIAKVMVARDGEEASELDDEFTIGFIGHGTGDKPSLSHEDVGSIADLIEEKAISPVGGLDCGECGYDTCREFVLAAIEGEAPSKVCAALQGPVSLSVDGRRVPLKSFVKDLIARTISGMVSSLRRTEGGKIEIEVERREG